jgi:hypothetical protein
MIRGSPRDEKTCHLDRPTLLFHSVHLLPSFDHHHHVVQKSPQGSFLFLAKEVDCFPFWIRQGHHTSSPSSVDTIRPAATLLGRSSSLDTTQPIIRVEDVNGDVNTMTADQGEEEESHGINGQKRRGSEGWEEELQRREQLYPPPKLDDEERVIEVKEGYILTSKRKLALWKRGWVNLDTWFEDEMKKMDEDPAYIPMGCGL